MTESETVVANHHGHHPGFSGVSGVVGALSMLTKRSGTARLAIDLTELTSTDRVVDIGAGTGFAARMAARVAADVVAVEPATIMRRVARCFPSARRVHWTPGVAENIPLPDDAATVAWSLATVHHWPDVEGGLAEVRRVLRPGGRFLAMERRVPDGSEGLASHGWFAAQPERFADDCRAAGFVDVTVSNHDSDRGVQFAVLAVAPD